MPDAQTETGRLRLAVNQGLGQRFIGQFAEDGFAAVNRLGGHSIRVGADGPSAARYRLASPDAVRDWLATVAAQIVDTASEQDGESRSALR